MGVEDHRVEDVGYIIFAPNIHTGGGLVQLQAVCDAWTPNQPLAMFLDARAQAIIAPPSHASVYWCTPTISGRMRAEWRLARLARATSITVCLHNLPPALRLRGLVICYVQNRLLFEAVDARFVGLRVRTRWFIERVMASTLIGNVDRYFVQTPSMAQLVASFTRRPVSDIGVAPFATLSPVRVKHAPDDAVVWDFIYISDGQAHKNHRRLIEAWQMLAEAGIRPTLAITLGSRDKKLAREMAEAARGLRVVNLGTVAHREVLSLYSKARALIFPSTIESFGLPLIEADAAGLPIVAPELDYVRDVCTPSETFDPESAISIARAVRRFLGEPEPKILIENPSFLVDRIVAERNSLLADQV